jgi:ABC-type Na+ efflux pump permease subunit
VRKSHLIRVYAMYALSLAIGGLMVWSALDYLNGDYASLPRDLVLLAICLVLYLKVIWRAGGRNP